MSKKIVLAGACRTAVGKMGGTLANTPATDLATHVIKESIKRAGIKPTDVDQVLLGCVLQAGLGQNMARQASVNAGLPVEVPAMTLNILCGSGLNAVNTAAFMIQAGAADVIIAGGAENMSAAPYLVKQGRYGYRMGHGQLLDTMISDGLTDAFNQYHMGVTAENVAKEYDVTRDDQDELAAVSQQRASKARAEGIFDEEIAPVEIKGKKGKVTIVDKDEYIRDGVTKEGISGMKPAFIKDGTVTAANASGINDGAAMVIVMSEDKAKELGVEPMAKIASYASAGVDPKIMGTGPIPSSRKALEKAGWEFSELDLIEANEAFAAQAGAVAKTLGLDMDKTNVNGGAIAIGHPIGASGTRILTTLLYEMKRRDAKKGLATLCIGGGMGTALTVER